MLIHLIVVYSTHDKSEFDSDLRTNHWLPVKTRLASYSVDRLFPSESLTVVTKRIQTDLTTALKDGVQDTNAGQCTLRVFIFLAACTCSHTVESKKWEERNKENTFCGTSSSQSFTLKMTNPVKRADTTHILWHRLAETVLMTWVSSLMKQYLWAIQFFFFFFLSSCDARTRCCNLQVIFYNWNLLATLKASVHPCHGITMRWSQNVICAFSRWCPVSSGLWI